MSPDRPEDGDLSNRDDRPEQDARRTRSESDSGVAGSDEGLAIDRREFVRNVGGVAGAGALFGGTGTGGAAGQAGPAGVPATVTEDVEQPTAIRTFPVLDTDGEQTGTRTWRTVQGTGNCCENYLGVAPDGSVYDMGGELTLHATPDRGKTWNTIEPPTPYRVTSEGCVSATPTGDVVAVDWNPYSTDRLVAFKYVAAEDAWYYNETPVKPPFYDRPWMSVLPGPFTVAGQEVPYLVVQRGGVGRPDDVLLVSLDGLNYFVPSDRQIDSLVTGNVERFLADLPEDEIMDYVQPHVATGVSPLGDGAAMADGASASCDTVIATDGTLRWSCFDTPAGLPEGRPYADSRGYLHGVTFADESTFVYRYSTDGGKSWSESTFTLPANYVATGGAGGVGLFDFKVHGGHDIVAVAVHATDRDQEVDQDMVFKIRNAVEGSRTTEVLYVGRADVSYVVGASTAERFDFTTVGILPEDGRIVVSFADLTHTKPQVAFEVDDRPELPPFHRLGRREDDSNADSYFGGQTARMDLRVEARRECRVRDPIPAAWSVDADHNPDVAFVEHRPDESRKYVHLEPQDGTTVLDATYFATTPDEPTQTGRYDLGPLQANPGDGTWRPVDDTAATYVVIGGRA